MKNKTIISFLILLLATTIGLWGLPVLVKKASYSPDDFPFVYYSSGLKEIALIDYKNKEFPMSDLAGNQYSTAEFDTLMPLLNYRQLMSDGRLPDSIQGIEITPQLLRSKSVVYKYMPRYEDTPNFGLYILFESMPKRVGLEMPDDVFRMKNSIEFVDVKTNTINQEKSERFAKELQKRGYTFPTQWAVGNPNIRKPYDEGYFCLDAKGELFHMKMVNGRPFVRNTDAGKTVDIASFSILEVPDKRFYGFLFSKQGETYILESTDGKYTPVKLDIPAFNLKKDEMSIIGNLFYWTIFIANESGRDYYVLNSEDLKSIDKHHISKTGSKWDIASQWLFPYYLTFESSDSDYIYPRIHFTSFYGFAVNALLALIGFFVLGRSKRLFNAGFILVFGVAGLIGLFLLPEYRNK